MKRLCDWFNRHRDGMLDPEQQREFESHMAGCEECRERSLLLNNLVEALKSQELPDLADRPELVADRAYEQCKSWDVLFLSWLRPTPAWSALAVLAILVTFLWVAPNVTQTGSISEYEVPLQIEVEQISQSVNTATDLTDDQLELWLEQGGTAK